jgi:predicted DNA-binding protein
MQKQNVSATIEKELLKRLDAVATQSERNRSWLISQAIAHYLEELEDYQAAKDRLHDERLSPTALRRAIGLHR